MISVEHVLVDRELLSATLGTGRVTAHTGRSDGEAARTTAGE